MYRLCLKQEDQHFCQDKRKQNKSTISEKSSIQKKTKRCQDPGANQMDNTVVDAMDATAMVIMGTPTLRPIIGQVEDPVETGVAKTLSSRTRRKNGHGPCHRGVPAGKVTPGDVNYQPQSMKKDVRGL